MNMREIDEVARALYASDYDADGWDDEHESTKNVFRNLATEIIVAIDGDRRRRFYDGQAIVPDGKRPA